MADATGKRAPLSVKLGAELFGTFVLTFTAAGADIVDQLFPNGIGHVARYSVRGLAVMAMIWALSGISGAHLNPAVSLGFFFRRVFSGALVAPYVAVQFAGAIIAAFTLQAMFPGHLDLGISKPLPPFNDLQAVLTEIILTAFLTFTILGTMDQKAVVGKNDALAVGGVVALCGLGFSPISGASMNPARSLGPMIVSVNFAHAYVYLVAPVIGAAIAAVICRLIYGAPKADSKDGAGGQPA